MVVKGKKLFRILGVFISLILVLSLLVVLEVNGVFTKNDGCVIEVKSGETFSDVLSTLKEEDMIFSKTLFKGYAKVFHSDKISNIKAGKYTFGKNLSYENIIKVLSNEPQYGTVSVTIPEGFELREIAALLEEKGLCDKEKFLKVADTYDFDFKYKSEIKNNKNRLEGFLFPDTYIFAKDGTDEVLIIKTMLQRFLEIYEKYENNNSGYSVYEIITLASIIEREGKSNEDFYNISSVFHNRLKRTDYLNRLQSCATVQYILKDRKAVLSVADTKIDSPYNTYINPGLPIGPISSPGERAIDAAINPNNTDYLYFLNDENGKLYFSKTLDEHNKVKNVYVN